MRTVIAGLPVQGLVVVRKGSPGERGERARKKALGVLLRKLDDRDCAHLTWESRGPKDDQRDMRTLDQLRAGRQIGSRLRLDHLPGPAEPMLWVADAVCGAVVGHRVGQPRWLEILGTSTVVVDT